MVHRPKVILCLMLMFLILDNAPASAGSPAVASASADGEWRQLPPGADLSEDFHARIRGLMPEGEVIACTTAIPRSSAGHHL